MIWTWYKDQRQDQKEAQLRQELDEHRRQGSPGYRFERIDRVTVRITGTGDTPAAERKGFLEGKKALEREIGPGRMLVPLQTHATDPATWGQTDVTFHVTPR